MSVDIATEIQHRCDCGCTDYEVVASEAETQNCYEVRCQKCEHSVGFVTIKKQEPAQAGPASPG